MKDEVRRREAWETRDSLDNMVDRGMRQFKKKAELSGGWKKAGIGLGIATLGVAAVLGIGYLRNIFPLMAQNVVQENNGSVYSSLIMINGNEGNSAGETVIYIPAETAEPTAAQEEYIIEPLIAPTKTPEPTPEPTEYRVEPLYPFTAQDPAPEDMFSVWLSKATLYNGGYDALVEDINNISGSSGTIYYAQLHDENNTLVVEYVGVGYPETFPVEEDVIDSLIAETRGLRHESIHISGTELERLLVKNGSSLGELAGHISEYCSGSHEASYIEEYLRGAQLVNFVPGNGEHPLLNIIWPEWVYTFHAKGNENMQTLMDLAYIPK